MSYCQSHQKCIETARSNAQRICQERGVRFTPLREKVLTLVWNSHLPVKAYDLMDQLVQGQASAKPPTVYRALNFLEANGLVHKLSSQNAYIGCSHPVNTSDEAQSAQQHACYFLICSHCGVAQECCSSGLADSIANTAKQHQFSTTKVCIEIEGVCALCQPIS